MQAIFEIIERPDGQFILRHDKEQYGPFPDRPTAEAGMMRVITPKIFRYDETGKPYGL